MHPAMDGDRQWRSSTKLAMIVDKGLISDD